MSRSAPTAKNPATRFFTWKGSEGKIVWYDKEAEKQKEVAFSAEKPFTFLVLDELNTITGFSDSEKSSFWSNEVRDLQKEELTVRTSNGIKARGVYKDLADVKSKGAKYAKSVYIAFKDDTGELAIGNFRLSGAALTAWIGLQKKLDVYKAAVALTGAQSAKKGATSYFIPVFEGRNVTPETDAEARVLDKELQAYLGIYLSRVQEEATSVAAEDYPEDDEETTTTEDAPEKESEEKTVNGINITDVPF